MKRIFILLILVAFVYTANAQEVSKEYVENELIVWLKPGVDATEFAKKAPIPHDCTLNPQVIVKKSCKTN